LQLTPNNAVVQTQLGALYLRSGQLETARQALLKAAQMNPRNPLAYLDLGLTLQQMGKPEEALDAYQKAAELQSNLVVAQFAIGQLSMGLKRYDDAIAAFQQTAKLRPNDPSVLIWLGHAYQAKGMNQQAQETFGRAYQLRQQQAPQRPAR
jgi:superkiller protein 3